MCKVIYSNQRRIVPSEFSLLVASCCFLFPLPLLLIVGYLNATARKQYPPPRDLQQLRAPNITYAMMENDQEDVVVKAAMPARQAIEFMSLPLEIRISIYKFTWESREIRLDFKLRILALRMQRLSCLPSCDNQKYCDPNNPSIARCNVFSHTTQTTEPPPRTLFINTDSRTETLKHYKLAFAMQPKAHLRHCHGGIRSDISNQYISHVYFNFSRDVLVVPEPAFELNQFLSKIRFADLAQVRYVQIRDMTDRVKTQWTCPNERLPMPYGQFPLQARATDFGPIRSYRKRMAFGRQKSWPKNQEYCRRAAADKQNEADANRDGRDSGGRGGEEENTEEEKSAEEDEMEADEEPEGIPLILTKHEIWEEIPTEPNEYYDFYENSPFSLGRKWARESLKDIFRQVQEVDYAVAKYPDRPAEIIATVRIVSADEARRTASRLSEDIYEDWERKVAQGIEALTAKPDSQAKLERISREAFAAAAISVALRPPRRTEDPGDHDAVALRDFVDDRPHLQFVPGRKLKGRSLMHKFLDSMIRWFPLVEVADENGPDQQIGFHWLGARVENGWIKAAVARNGFYGTFWTLKSGRSS